MYEVIADDQWLASRILVQSQNFALYSIAGKTLGQFVNNPWNAPEILGDVCLVYVQYFHAGVLAGQFFNLLFPVCNDARPAAV